MAEQQDNNIQQFNKSLNTELSSPYIGKNSWTHARNAINSTSTGDTGVIGNEPANRNCINTPYTIIGFIYLYEDNWIVISTDDINSEIGLYKEFTCEYSKLPGNFNCLGLNRKNLITGVSRQNFDCTWSIYWSDKYLNPDRTLNINKIPYVGVYSFDTNGCEIFTPNTPLTLDCSKIKLNRLIKNPCIKITKGLSGGSLLNGSYIATVAYTINGQKVTDYLGLSNIQSIFAHDNLAGSLDIYVTGLDDSYDEYELTVISIVNQQTVARRIGLYSTTQQKISLDIIDNSLASVPLEFLPVHNPLMDSSDSISELGDNMIRVAPRTKFDFNYQPLANQILARWSAVEYPADYHRNGGPNTSYPRDENAAYFIQWEYDDGDLSSSFHIPGRAPLAGETANNVSANAIEILDGGTAQQFEVVNTASLGSTTVVPIGDGGYQIAEGNMGYYETSEKYPVNKPLVWGNLCGKNIRHHKFPEPNFNNLTKIYSDTAVSPIVGPVIRIMGVKFNNIKPPVDNAGNVISNIVGYRILKGSREGNKTVIANGIINNTIRYALQDGTGKEAVYPNYPYNDISNNDPFLSTTKTTTNLGGNIIGYTQPSPFPYPQGNTMLDILTFHSPDTNFRKPFLASKELKIYGEVVGEAILEFKHPEKHPKHKLLTNLAFIVSAIAGIGYAALKLNGKRSVKYISPHRNAASQPVSHLGNISVDTWVGTLNNVNTALETGNSLTIPDAVVVGQFAAGTAASLAAQAAFVTADTLYNAGQGLVEALGGANVTSAANSATLVTANGLAAPSTLVEQGSIEVTQEGGHNSAMGTVLSILGGINLFITNWGQGTNESIELLKNFSKWEQHALQQLSHCFYNGFNPRSMSQYRHHIDNAQYLGSSFQQLDANLKVNNLYRASSVLLKTTSRISGTATIDDTKHSLETLANMAPPVDYKDPESVVKPRQAASHYGALKIRLRNQYGQIGDVKQIPVSCVNFITLSSDTTLNIFSSPVIFGGDMYITRYTEKNTMFFFSEWLYGQPDGFEYDYLSRKMLPFPKYWIDSKSYDSGDFLNALGTNITSLSFNNPVLPSGFRALDRDTSVVSLFTVKDAYFYLFSSSVKDFYVESEINVGYRDWEEPVQKRHYDNKTYTGLLDMFAANPEVIKVDNFYKYDYSLSAAKAFINFASWANVQPTYYDPYDAETCFVKHPKRVIYSLPQQVEQVRDSWRIFLANNYRDFRSDVLTLKSIGENGAVIFFYSDSPIQIQGTETLQTNAGTKLTIGDGELLQQTKQNLTNADRPYQYGSCQNLRSIINTPIGLFWIGQDQGKIYTAAQGIMNIALAEMASWFARYLPYELVKDFPTFELKDNAIMGVACQSIYDSDYDLIYFTKKDYKLKTNLPPGTTVVYISGNDFMVNGILPIKLGNPNYFDSASWTMSYNARERSWLSWHDWHPDLMMPSKNTFSSIKINGIWKHNDRCDLFCNYYGVDYPFEIEWQTNTGLQINTLRSIEYQAEIYKYADNCYDRYLFLDTNFDEAVIFNNEQCSGLLKLNLAPYNDPWISNSYPIFNANSMDILYSRVENKYRFNTFFDLTDDRGQFTTAERMIWNTEANGYVKNLNPLNLNYSKDAFERKKFRGYTSSVFLRRKISGNKKFLLNFSVNKLQNSPR